MAITVRTDRVAMSSVRENMPSSVLLTWTMAESF